MEGAKTCLTLVGKQLMVVYVDLRAGSLSPDEVK